MEFQYCLVLLCLLQVTVATLTRKTNLVTETLADKIENLFAVKSVDPQVGKLKIQLKDQIEINFVKMMASHVIHNPIGDTRAVLELMKMVLNDQVDFLPVVDQLPTLLRQGDQSQVFQSILSSIREKKAHEIPIDVSQELRQQQNSTRITKAPPSQFETIISAVSKVNVGDLAGFIKQIPDIFEGIQTIVDSFEDVFG